MKKLRLFLIIAVLALAVAALWSFNPKPVYADEEYQVVFYVSDTEEYKTQAVAGGGYAVIPETPEKEDSIFLYWEKEDGSRFSFKTPITEDLSLFAKWYTLETNEKVAEMFTVDFRVEGVSVNVQNVEKGGSAVAPTSFAVPEGKAFVGWVGDYTSVNANVIVNALLETKRYNVSVYGLDDRLVADLKIAHGESVDVTGQTFKVDHYILNEEKAAAELSNVVGDKDVYLEYSPESYEVDFIADGESFAEPQNVLYGECAKFPALPSKENHIFIGWYKDLDAAAMYDFGAPIEDDLTLIAKFMPIENKKYSVKFYNYDGVQYGGTQKVEEGKTAIVPGTPYREGYTFLGWFINGEVGDRFDFSAPVESDVSVYALFRIRTYSVVVIDGNTVISEQTVNYGDTAVQPVVTDKEGYIFIGFDESFKNVTKDTIIHTVYKAKTYAVMFFDRNYKKIGATQYVEYMQAATEPTAPAVEGYRFVSWSEDTSVITDDIAVFPIYEKLKFTYNFYDGEALVKTAQVEYGDKAEMPVAEKEGYIFIGWMDGEVVYDFNTSATSDKNLYASWEEKPDVIYTVTFIVDGAEYSVQSVKEGGSAITPADPVKEGYTFTGWDKDFADVSDDITITANFEINVYTITFIVEGVESTISCEYGDKIAAPATPEKEGHDFAYWAKIDGGRYDFDSTIKGDLELKAVFEAKIFDVAFVVDGKTVSEQAIAYGGFAQVPVAPAAEGMTFAGWFVGEAEFDFTAPITGDVTAQAVFTAREYEIYYYLNGELYDIVSVGFGDRVTALPAPELDDWEIFSGWVGVPETMPNRPVAVSGTIAKVPTHVISYYLNGRLYAAATYHEGETVTPKDEPELNEHEIFGGWTGEPETMPEEDVVVYGEITAEKQYTITYYLNGKVSVTKRHYAGDAIDAMMEPAIYPHQIFSGWIGEPEVMPEEDVAVYGTITDEEKYTVTFLIDGEIYLEIEYYCGEAIILPKVPVREGYVFFWGDYPETMPEEDVTVCGAYELVVIEERMNVFTLEIRETSDGYSVTLVVKENVNVGGFIGSIEGVFVNEKDISILYENVTVNAVDGSIRFVFSSGDNITYVKSFFSFTTKDLGEIDLVLNGVYAFDDDGVVTTADYCIE